MRAGRGARRAVVARLASVAMLVLVLGGCTTLNVQPSADVTTLEPSWPSRFRLDWSVEPDSKETRRIAGYVHNTYINPMMDVRLLTQALDKSGGVVAQRLQSIARVVSALGDSYFEVRNLPPAEQYRVTVWSYTTLELPSSWD